MKFSDIKTIILNNVQLDTTVSYDIFDSFVNVTTLKVINSHLTSKGLNNLLTYINPYSLSKLDLTGSVFDHFNQSDLIHLGSLFALTLIPPSNMNGEDQEYLEKLLGGY